jgi:hypothetical protein
MARTAALLTALVLAGLLASSASADKPIRFGIPPSNLDFAAGDLCPFSVSIKTLETKQFGISFSNGVTATHGRFIVSVTNNDAGLTRVFDLSGSVRFANLSPVVIRAETDGVTLSFFPRGAFGGNEDGSLILTHGRTVEVDDFTNFPPLVDSFSVLSGSSEDLCKTMATS